MKTVNIGMVSAFYIPLVLGLYWIGANEWGCPGWDDRRFGDLSPQWRRDCQLDNGDAADCYRYAGLTCPNCGGQLPDAQAPPSALSMRGSDVCLKQKNNSVG